MLRRIRPGPIQRALPVASVAALAVLLTGCASRSMDVRPLPANAADFAGWTCAAIDDELDLVRQRATEVAYSVDERAGNNILALGVGFTLFWPALLAMRPDGLEAEDLARLKGRDEALRAASRERACPPAAAELPAARAAAVPFAVGERLVFEDRANPRQPALPWSLTVTALRRDHFDFELDSPSARGPWRQDAVGNVVEAPDGALHWTRLMRANLALGQVLAGDMLVAGDASARARLRGQVVAVGPQTLAGRSFDVAVIELFGDAWLGGDDATRVEGAIAVDRGSGVVLRLDLRSAVPRFSLQRRLLHVEPVLR